MIKLIDNYILLQKSKKIVAKSCKDQFLAEDILDIIFCLNAAFKNLKNTKKELFKNFNKGWQLERAYILYFLTEKTIADQSIFLDFKLRNALEDTLLDWIIDIYEQTYDKDNDEFLWQFVETRATQYNEFFPEDTLDDKPLHNYLFNQKFCDVLAYNFLFNPGKINIDKAQITSAKLMFDTWMPLYGLTKIDIQHVLLPYMDFVTKKLEV